MLLIVLSGLPGTGKSEGRTRSLADLPEPTWDEVRERARTYEPWDGCPVVDSSQPHDVVVAQVAAAVDAPIDSAWEA